MFCWGFLVLVLVFCFEDCGLGEGALTGVGDPAGLLALLPDDRDELVSAGDNVVGFFVF